VIPSHLASPNSVLKLLDQIAAHTNTEQKVYEETDHDIPTNMPQSVYLPLRVALSSFVVDCVMNGGVGGTDVHVLQKAYCAEICAIVSQFGSNGLGTSSSAQLAGYKNSATN